MQQKDYDLVKEILEQPANENLKLVLWKKYLPKCRKHAYEMERKFSFHLDKDDVIHEYYFWFLECLKKVDLEKLKGCSFGTFFHYFILKAEGAIRDEALKRMRHEDLRESYEDIFLPSEKDNIGEQKCSRFHESQKMVFHSISMEDEVLQSDERHMEFYRTLTPKQKEIYDGVLQSRSISDIARDMTDSYQKVNRTWNAMKEKGREFFEIDAQ